MQLYNLSLFEFRTTLLDKKIVLCDMASCVTMRCCRLCGYEQTPPVTETVLWRVLAYQMTRCPAEGHIMNLYSCENLKCLNILTSVPRSWNMSCPWFRNASYLMEMTAVGGPSSNCGLYYFGKSAAFECSNSHPTCWVAVTTQSMCTTLCLCTGTIDGYALWKQHYAQNF
jgi:hypothetical protein